MASGVSDKLKLILQDVINLAILVWMIQSVVLAQKMQF